jgi:L-malate glycosyltransferase
MKILFLSTQVSPPWGGGEELWSETAIHALEKGHQVAVWVSQRKEKHPKLLQLERNGAYVHYWPSHPPNLSIARRISERVGLSQKSPAWSSVRWVSANDSMPFQPDVICISQGGTYCALQTVGLLEWIQNQSRPFIALCHSHRVWTRPNVDLRESARRFFRNAHTVGFVAQANLDAARRFLAMDLPQALLVQNPVNLIDQSAVTWPDEAKPRFATVARLTTRDKGQDLLLEALADPVWKERDFQLDFYGGGPDREILEDLITLYGLEGKVRIAGLERSGVERIHWQSSSAGFGWAVWCCRKRN